MDELNVNRMLRVIEGAWGRLGDERVVFYSRWLAQLAGDPASIEGAIMRLAETEPRLPSIATLRAALAGVTTSTIQYGNHDPAVIGQMIVAIRELAADLGQSRDQDWRIPLAGVYLAELDFAKISSTAHDAGFHRDRAEAARRILEEEGDAARWCELALRDAREYEKSIALGGIRRIIEHEPSRLDSYLIRKGHLFQPDEIARFREEAAAR